MIPGDGKYDVIYSEEGGTQGDVTAMEKYGIATKPLGDKLAMPVNSINCKGHVFKYTKILIFLHHSKILKSKILIFDYWNLYMWYELSIQTEKYCLYS